MSPHFRSAQLARVQICGTRFLRRAGFSGELCHAIAAIAPPRKSSAKPNTVIALPLNWTNPAAAKWFAPPPARAGCAGSFSSIPINRLLPFPNPEPVTTWTSLNRCCFRTSYWNATPAARPAGDLVCAWLEKRRDGLGNRHKSIRNEIFQHQGRSRRRLTTS